MVFFSFTTKKKCINVLQRSYLLKLYALSNFMLNFNSYCYKNFKLKKKVYAHLKLL